MQGFLGDEIVVNGSQKRISNVKKASYRLRLLNGSNSRIYKLAWNDGSDIIAIATDGGLLEKPERMPYIMLAPGERVEIWKDFSSYSTWEEVQLKSLAFNPGSSMQMRGMMTDSETRTKNGDEFDIYSFKITSEQGPQLGLPASLSDLEVISQTEAVNNTSARKFNFSFERMEWVINGETFEMYEVADWEKVKLNSTEIWEFTNGTATGGMGMMGNMMQMPHPVHLHGLQFQILERDISQVDPGTWNSVKYGFLDKGWQDTFLLLPGMKVRIIMRFKDFTGMYIYHCHNLEHEDMGMMRNYEVIP